MRLFYMRARLLAAIVLMQASSACVYRDWVHTAAAQPDYPQLIDHVRSNEELQGQLDKQTDKVFREGEHVSDWQEMGVDIGEVLAAQPGGVEQNALFGKQSWFISAIYGHPHDDLFGPAFNIFHVEGSEGLFLSEAAASYELIRAAPGVWVQLASDQIKMGNAACGQSTAVRLYTRRAIAELGTPEAANVALIVAGTQRVPRNPRNCSVMVPAGDQSWRPMHFTPEGRRLPVADREGGSMRIIPLTELRRILAEE